MKKISLFFILIVGCLLTCVAQNIEKDKSSAVKVLVASAEKEKCLLELDQKLYLVAVSDVQLIDKEQILSIQMYMPGMDEFNSLVSKADMKNEKIICSIVISTKPGTKLPQKFVVEPK